MWLTLPTVHASPASLHHGFIGSTVSGLDGGPYKQDKVCSDTCDVGARVGRECVLEDSELGGATYIGPGDP